AKKTERGSECSARAPVYGSKDFTQTIYAPRRVLEGDRCANQGLMGDIVFASNNPRSVTRFTRRYSQKVPGARVPARLRGAVCRRRLPPATRLPLRPSTGKARPTF